MHLLELFPCSTLIHICCSSEYLGQQDGVCGTESK